jgi:membrane-bound lytic murein transglycosylase MltF
MALLACAQRHSAAAAALVVLVLAAGPGCRGGNDEAKAGVAAIPPATADESFAEAPSPYDALPPAVREAMDKSFTGDLDGMIERRVIRAGVTFNRTHYFIDKGQQRGATYEAVKLFEDELNKAAKTGKLKVNLVFVPLARDQLYKALIDGKVDFVAAMVTVTPEREKLVAFSEPTRKGVNQVLVTGPGAPPIASLDDLAGREVFIRKSSLYAESVAVLNAQLKARGKPAVTIREAPEVFEDDDVLEMVNAGLVDATIVDDYLAKFWSQVFTGLTVHNDIRLRTGGILAVAMRKENPKLRKAINTWLGKHGEGDAFRNTVEQRYLSNVKYARNAASEAEREKLGKVADLFKKYGAQYNLDFLLMAAQGYQESTLDQSARNPSGAIGVMQVLPTTAKDLKVGDITKLEPNIHAGVKYVRFMMDTYYKDDPMDPLNKGLMTFASYNAGPGRIRQLRREAEKRGLDPNLWFGNVERVASERIGRETVTYVSNIYKYYVAYRLVFDQMQMRDAAKAQIAPK